jgi:hypothetical protein
MNLFCTFLGICNFCYSVSKYYEYREYGLSIAELGYDPRSTSSAKTRRILTLTGVSDAGPALFSETA